MGRKKKAAADVNKAEEVRKYMATHPQAKNKEIREALAQRGIKIAPNYATVIKSQMKAKEQGRRLASGGSVARPAVGRPKKAARVGRRPRVAKPEGLDLDQLAAAADFAQLCGGTDNAIEALQAADDIYQKMREVE